MIQPTLAQAKEYAKEFNTIPLALELYSDQKTPIEILRNIQKSQHPFSILESVRGGDTWGRYTFLTYAPTLTFRGLDGKFLVNGSPTPTSDLGGEIRRILAKYRSPRIPNLPPFTGGLVGYFSYDCVQYFQPGLTLNCENPEGFEDVHLMLMDKVVAFDHFRQKMFLIVNISTYSLEQAYETGLGVLKEMEETLLAPSFSPSPSPPLCGAFEALFSKEEYCKKVAEIQDSIRAGEIFQAVLSNRLSAPFQGNLLEAYRTLRTTNPSPYMVYFRFDNLEIAGASPETLIRLKNGQVSTFPLAGTCPRNGNEAANKAWEDTLLADEKERAEHDMLVDLGRNDLGKISQFASVEVREYRQIKRFSHVSHLASRVTGTLREDRDAVDAIAAALPAGTLCGAPKRRACELLDGWEGTKRGPYGGAIGYLDFTGNMDLCIGIRLAVLKNNKVFVQSGGGIVADSVPEREYCETLNKAQAVIEALGMEKERSQ